MAADRVAAADAATIDLCGRPHANPLAKSARLPEPDIREIRGEGPGPARRVGKRRAAATTAPMGS
jgi:hypothetical protein